MASLNPLSEWDGFNIEAFKEKVARLFEATVAREGTPVATRSEDIFRIEADVALEKPYKSVGIARHDDATIVLPTGMSLGRGSAWLSKLEADLEKMTAFSQRIPCHPIDGANALANAIAETYGHARTVPTQTMWGPRPPQLIEVPTDAYGGTVRIPWGHITLPGFDTDEEWLSASVDLEDNRPYFVIEGRFRKKHEELVGSLANLTRKKLADSSLYRGKAIRVEGFHVDPENYNPQHKLPQFINVKGVTMDNVVLNEDCASQITDYVLGPIRFPDASAGLGVSKKRGVLMHGTFGVGKTLVSKVIALEATQKGMTFIYLENPEDLSQAYRFAMQYAPAVLFVEDVDKVTNNRDKGKSNDILNILDGIDSKDSDVMVVFTTNELEAIHSAFSRPGRIDVIVEIPLPDLDSAGKLVQLYAKESLSPEADLGRIGKALEGNIPAVIAEAVNRAKLSALRRAGGDPSQLLITELDIELAASSLTTTRRLLERPQTVSTSSFEEIGKAAVRTQVRVLETNGLRRTES